jgi:hypothetical protein
LRDRVERRRLREVLGQRRGDPVEAALHARLAHALLEACGVPNCERCETGERLEQVRLELAEEAVRVARRHAEHAAALSRPRHLGRDRAAETLVRPVRNGLAEPLVDRTPHRELELHELRVEPVDGRAAKNRMLGVEQVAIGRVRIEELGHLDDEPLENGLQPELARHDLSGFQQRGLLLEATVVLLEQLGRVDRDAELARDRLGQCDLRVGPVARLRAVEAEDADHPIEDEDRRDEHGERVEVEQGLDAAHLRVLERRLLANVADRDRAPLAGREIRSGQVLRHLPDRDEALVRPLGGDRHRRALFSEPQEAAADACGQARGLDCDAEQVVEVELGANLAGDRGDEAFAFQRVGELIGGARAVERECGFSGERLKQ